MNNKKAKKRAPQKKMRKKVWYKNINLYLALILLLSIVYFIYQLWDLNTLPMKFFLPLGIVLVVVGLLLVFSLFHKRISKLNRMLCRILTVLLCVVLIVGNVLVFQARSALDKVSVNDSDVQYDTVSVVVKKDNKAKKIEDVKNKAFATSKIDNEVTQKAVKQIDKDVHTKIKTKQYPNSKEQANALYNNDVEVLLMNEAYRSLIVDDHPAFNKETKVIGRVKIPKKTKKIGKAVNVLKDPYNVVISGIDTFGPIETTSRSDVDIIATVNPNTHQILMTSIPRDYYVKQSCQNNQKDKLTHTGIFGIACTVGTIQDLFDVPINYYVRLNFNSLEDIVDALGGIDINNEIAFNSGVDGTYIPAGEQHMNGKTALLFARERHAYESGDRQRGRNQMMVISALINKAKSPAILSGYSSIMSAIGDTIQTDMKPDDMTSIVKQQLNDGADWDIQEQSVTGDGESAYSPANGFDSYVMVPNQDSINKAVANINKMLDGQKITINK